jgi:hypothetical protein
MYAGIETSVRPDMSHRGFIKNSGQVYDMYGKPCPNVLYTLELSGMNVYVTEQGFTYTMARFKDAPEGKESLFMKYKNEHNKMYDQVARMDINLLGAEIKKENCIEEKKDDSQGVINYYSGPLDESARGLHFITKLRVKNIYPNVDWLIMVDAEKGLKADYVVNPGGDISKIKMEFKGTTSLNLSDNDQIINAATPLESFRIGKLECSTQSGDKVNSHYNIIEENIVTVSADTYDANQALIIDPFVYLSRTWSTYFGGSNEDRIRATKMDISNAKFYFVGVSYSIQFPPLWPNGSAYYSNNFNNAFNPANQDMFIFQTDLVGQRIWCTYVWSQMQDDAFNIGVDHAGDIYMVGETQCLSSVTYTFPMAGGPTTACPSCFIQKLQTCAPGNPQDDGVIVEFDPIGQLVWSTTFGAQLPCNNNADEVWGVAFNSHDDLIICGVHQNDLSGNYFTFAQNGSGYLYTNGGYGSSNVGFVAKFAASSIPSTGQHILQWSSYTPNLWNSSVCVDGSDNIFVCGWGNEHYQTFTIYQPPSYPNAFMQSARQGDNGTIMAFDNNTNLIWATAFNSDGDDYITNCDFGEYDRRLYICGRTEFDGGVYPFGPPGFPLINLGGYYDNVWQINGANPEKHGWYARFDGINATQPLRLDKTTLFAGNGHDEAVAISCGIGGNILLTGNNQSPSHYNSYPDYFPLRDPIGIPSPYAPDPPDLTNWDDVNGGNNDAYIAEFTEKNELLWCNYYGSDYTDEYATDIEVDGNFVLWTGDAWNDNGVTSGVLTVPEVPSSWQQLANGTLQKPDGMIAKFIGSGTAVRQAHTDAGETENGVKVISNTRTKKITVWNDRGDVNVVNAVLFDAAGRQIKTADVLNKNAACFNNVDLAPGMYVLKLQCADEVKTRKILWCNQ